MRPVIRGAVISLALSASLLTGVALADDANIAGTPLTLRGSKTAIANETAPTNVAGLLAKIGIVLTIGGAGAWWFLRRKQGDAKASSLRNIKIVTRTSVGLRQDLVWIEVAGQQLLLGVTPSQITTLAELDQAPTMEDEFFNAGDSPRTPTTAQKASRQDATPRKEPPARSSRDDAFADRLERTLGDRISSPDRPRREVARDPIADDEDLDDRRAQGNDDDIEPQRPEPARETSGRNESRGQASLHERVVAMLDRTRELENEMQARKPRMDLDAPRSSARTEATRPPQDPSPSTVEGQARGLLRRRG
jgi:flagellar protein FliO/FliZ